MRTIFSYSICFGLVGLGLSLTMPTTASAQNVSVQLPTVRQFGVSTTVSVPDRGGVLLGGVSRSGSSFNSSGVPLLLGGNRARGAYHSSAQASAHVWIHDFEAMEQALLAQRASHRTSKQHVIAGKETDSRLVAHWSVGESGALSVTQHRHQAETTRFAKLRKAEALIAKARRAEKVGKASLARTYYRLAQRQADAPLHRVIAKRIDALESASRQ